MVDVEKEDEPNEEEDKIEEIVKETKKEEDVKDEKEENAKEEEEKPEVVAEEENKNETQLMELKPQDLEEAVKIYDSIRAYRKKIDPKKDKILASEFDAKMKGVIDALKNGLKPNADVAVKNSIILRAKSLLIGISLEKMVETSVDRHTETIWKGIKDCYSRVIEGIFMVVDSLKKRNEEFENSPPEALTLRETIQTLEREIENGKEERANLQKEFEKEKAELNERIASLEEENKKCTEALLRHTKNNKSLGGISFPQGGSREHTMKSSAESMKESKVFLSAVIIIEARLSWYNSGPVETVNIEAIKRPDSRYIYAEG